MPSSLLSADIQFPQLTGEQSTDQKFKVLTDYLYMLLEQLRYSMGNLGRENFNDAAFDEIAGLITEPVYVQLHDAEGNIASLTATAEQLISRMSDAEGNISVLQQTSTSIMSQVTDLEGNVSTLQQTSQALSTRITDAEGNISSLTQTVNGFTLEVTNGATSSVIRLLSGSAQISSQVIQMDGLVTFTGLEDGTTVINGACIETGSVIASVDLQSPTIYAGEYYGNSFNIYPQSGNNGSFNLYGNFGGTANMFQIQYWSSGTSPRVQFDSPYGAYADWYFDRTNFYGRVDFSQATVEGLTTTAVFG